MSIDFAALILLIVSCSCQQAPHLSHTPAVFPPRLLCHVAIESRFYGPRPHFPRGNVRAEEPVGRHFESESQNGEPDLFRIITIEKTQGFFDPWQRNFALGKETLLLAKRFLPWQRNLALGKETFLLAKKHCKYASTGYPWMYFLQNMPVQDIPGGKDIPDKLSSYQDLVAGLV